MRLRRLLASAFAFLAISLLSITTSFAQTRDSTSVGGAGALAASNCQNIPGTWYAAGQVPAGYYKQISPPYDCKPIPSCPGNQSFNIPAAACQCAAGTAWNSSYGTCHTPCAGGTAWNGSSCAPICSPGTAWNGSTCASICTGGQTWNGSSCACPGGQAWNGSTCGAAPDITGFSVTPATQTVGSNFTVSWGATGADSLTLNCTGANANSSALSPTTGGTMTFVAAKSGSTTCTVTASSSYGSDSASTAAVSAQCSSGTAWNEGNSSCVSVCTGGQIWNGSACVCPAGLGWNNSTCGYAPSFTSFSLSPSKSSLGSLVAWSTTGAATSATVTCSGAIKASFMLKPVEAGSGLMPASSPGEVTCTGRATNSWGSGSATATGTAACPPSTNWDASTASCKAIPTPAPTPTPTGCPQIPGGQGNNLLSVAALSQALNQTVTQAWHQGYPEMLPTVPAGAPGQTVNQDVITGWCSQNPVVHQMCGMLRYPVRHTCQSNGTWTSVCPGTNTWNGKMCVPPRVINVTGHQGRNLFTVMKVTPITPSNILVQTVHAGTGTVVDSCTLTTVGQFCHMNASGFPVSNHMKDADGGVHYANSIVDNMTRLGYPAQRSGSVASARLDANGSFSLWYTWAGGNMDFYQSSSSVLRSWNSGSITGATWQGWAAGSTNTVNMTLIGYE